YHHFKNKEGIVAALFFSALDDQTALRDEYLKQSKTLKDVVEALIYSYVDWVSEQPEFAKFLITARFNIIEGEEQQQLTQKNKSRNQKIFSLISILVVSMPCSKKQSKASNNICRFKAALLPGYKRSNKF
ncbi:TetR/AcrR family transcriptional regulator, partial [Bacillus sp. B-TM1]